MTKFPVYIPIKSNHLPAGETNILLARTSTFLVLFAIECLGTFVRRHSRTQVSLAYTADCPTPNTRFWRGCPVTRGWSRSMKPVLTRRQRRDRTVPSPRIQTANDWLGFRSWFSWPLVGLALSTSSHCHVSCCCEELSCH